MMRARLWGSQNNRLLFMCLGCGEEHSITVNSDAANRPVWEWNGSLELPTIKPSILRRGTQHLTDDEHERIMAGEKIEPRPLVCHTFITDGRIQYLDDCTHTMAGKTVDLPEITS